MSLRTKLESRLAVLLIALIAVITAVFAAIVTPAIGKLETISQEREVTIIQGLINRQLEDISWTNWDHSSWDVTYELMENYDREVIEVNLGDDSMEWLGLNVLLILDTQNRIYHEDFRDLNSPKPLQLPRLHDAEWRATYLIPDKSEPEKRGVVHTQAGPLLINARRILRSDDNGTSRGYLVMGRLVSAQLMMQLEEVAGRKFELVELSNSASRGSPIVSNMADYSTITVPLVGIDGTAGMGIEFNMRRQLQRQANIALVFFLGLIIALTIGSLLIVRKLLNDSVLAPVSALKGEMERFAITGQTAKSHTEQGSDELGDLAYTFHALQRELEQANSQTDSAMAKLRQSLKDAKRTEQQARIGSCVWDCSSRRLVACSDELAKIFSASPSDLMSRDSSHLIDEGIIHPDDLPAFKKAVAQGLSNGESFTTNFRTEPVPGAARSIRFYCDFECDPSGQPVSARVTCQDTTDIAELEEQLRQAEKLRTLGQLTGGVAHDFNNILVVIMGNIELAMRGDDPRHMPKEHLENALAAAKNAAKLIRYLLAYSQKQPMTLQPVNLRDLLQQLESVWASMLGEHFRLEFPELDGSWLVKTDPSQLETAMLNIIFNARDAMPSGGIIQVALEPSCSAVENEELIKISVKDHGSGMSSDIRRQAFEPFFTTKDSGDGSGLGLSMVYGYARQSGGNVEIETRLGQGTTVHLYLPRYQSTLSAVEEESSEQAASKGETILLVEDEPAVRRMVEAMLTQLGYQIIATEDAPAALRLLEHGTEVDLLFTDFVLRGDMSGLELARTVSEAYPALPILMTSGYPREQTGDLQFPMLQKPYQLNQLADAISDSLARRAA